MNITHAEDAAKYTKRALKEIQLKKLENDIAALGDRADRARELLGEINQVIFMAMNKGEGHAEYTFKNSDEKDEFSYVFRKMLYKVGYLSKDDWSHITLAWTEYTKDYLHIELRNSGGLVEMERW